MVVSYVGCAWFEFFILLLMDAGVVVSGASVLVSAWDMRVAPSRDGKTVHPAPLEMTGFVNASLYW